MARSSRWCLLFSLVAVFALIAGACSSGPTDASGDGNAPFPSSVPASQDQGPLKFLEWEGYQLPAFHQGFEQSNPNVDLQYQYANASAQFFSKVQAGGAQVDVAHPCVNWVEDWKNAGLIAPIDTSKLTHWSELNPNITKLGKIDGQYWFVPWDWGYESIIVNTDTAPIVPTSWADLWDPALQGQLSMEDFGEGAVKMASMALGLPYPNLSASELDQVKQKLMELRPNIRTLWSSNSDLVQQMANGDVSVGYGWNDQYAKIKEAGVPADYVNPTEGRAGWVCGFLIPSSTQHYDLALKYIDAAISPQSCAAAIDKYYLGCSNEQALQIADPANVQALQLDAQDVIASTNFDQSLTPQQRTEFNQIWSEVIAGLGG